MPYVVGETRCLALIDDGEVGEGFCRVGRLYAVLLSLSLPSRRRQFWQPECLADKWLQFIHLCRSGEDGTIAVDEEHSTASEPQAVLLPYIQFVFQVDEALLRVTIFFCGFRHPAYFFLTGDADNGEPHVLVFLIKRDEVDAMLTARTAPRCPEIYDRHLAFIQR